MLLSCLFRWLPAADCAQFANNSTGLRLVLLRRLVT